MGRPNFRNRVKKDEDLEALSKLSLLRWPNGVTCAYHDSAKVSHIKTRGIYQCLSCRKQFNVFTNTRWEDMKIKPSVFLVLLTEIFDLLKNQIRLKYRSYYLYSNIYKSGIGGLSRWTISRVLKKLEVEMEAIRLLAIEQPDSIPDICNLETKQYIANILK